MVVFGGEGRELADDPAALPPAYLLDVAGLVWRRVVARAEAPDACPGAGALHISTVSALRCHAHLQQHLYDHGHQTRSADLTAT